MHIVIAGGSGFLGRALTDALTRDGHDLVILSRQPTGRAASLRVRTVAWTPDGQSGPWATVIDSADAVINLAGESIAEGRWTDAKKQRIIDSRVDATRSLTTAIKQAAHPPAVLVSGSAVGFYGPLGDEVVTENRAAGTDFLAEVCVRWEAEAMRVDSARTRVACVRTGLVLERDGGALPQMLLPFRFGAGGPVGSGRQYLALDSPPRLDRFDPLRAGDTCRGRRGERDRPPPGDQCAVRAGARPRHAPAGIPAGAGVCPEAVAGRNGRRAAAVRPKRGARESREARLHLHLQQH